MIDLLRRLSFASMVVLIVGSGSGCSYVATTSLNYAPKGTPAAHPVPATLAVVPLREERPPRYYPSQLGRMFLTYIPLIPYVEIPYERLDESLQVAEQERGRSVPSDQLFPVKMAQAMTSDLAQAGLFERVIFVPEGAPDADYVLRGTLRSTEFDVNATSYMLGMAGVLLWLAPLPIGSNTADVVMDLELQDRAGAVLWTHPLRSDARRIFTLYNSGGAPVSNRLSLEIKRYGSNDKGIDGDSLWAYHADALRSGMGEAKQSLAAFLAAHPPASQSP